MKQRTNAEWLDALRVRGGDSYEEALADLRILLVRGLRYVLAPQLPNEYEVLAEDFAQDALLKILDNLGGFRGESLFTTWANKIAVRVALTELRRQRWRDLSLEALTTKDGAGDFMPKFLADSAPSPERQTNQQAMMELLLRLMQEALTERQWEAMNKLVLEGLSPELVAGQMGTNPNALYKLLHDARVRLKRALAEEGLTSPEIIELFSR